MSIPESYFELKKAEFNNYLANLLGNYDFDDFIVSPGTKALKLKSPFNDACMLVIFKTSSKLCWCDSEHGVIVNSTTACCERDDLLPRLQELENTVSDNRNKILEYLFEMRGYMINPEEMAYDIKNKLIEDGHRKHIKSLSYEDLISDSIVQEELQKQLLSLREQPLYGPSFIDKTLAYLGHMIKYE